MPEYRLGCTAQDYAPSLHWCRKAAEQGLAEARYNLFLMVKVVAQSDMELNGNLFVFERTYA